MSARNSQKKRKLAGATTDDCEQPLMTPWGVKCRRLAHTHRAKYTEPYTVRGRWIKDLLPELCKSCRGSDISDEELDPILETVERVAPQKVSKRSKGRCMITKLPCEILRQILDYIVSSGCVYHFLPCRYMKEPAQVVQRLNNAKASFPTCVDVSLAATCSALHGTVCSILYGENDFIFNISAASINTSISSTTFSGFESWSRVLGTAPQSLGSIGVHAAKYIKHASLIIALPIGYGTREVGTLRAIVQKAVDVLRRATNMEHLTIDFQLPAWVGGHKGALGIDRLAAHVDAKTGKLNVRVLDPTLEPVWRRNKAERALEPLLGLKGVKEILLSGMISETFTEELRVAATSTGHS
ncbi:hypothetical protein LTR37_003685 [Vermiconidia calcicola]|uniref:Uncharacterized protein n=1 Tax=Vermiconidia calcicola TaxID=1690605 RepID=A0ACC3NPQ5_9PEZI|nr:hypothetical protein LTR37_003685 [Vermiconidia calcicola]